MSAAPRPACMCGHPADFHDHYRSGSDCGTCDCRAYQQPRVPMFAWLRPPLRRLKPA